MNISQIIESLGLDKLGVSPSPGRADETGDQQPGGQRPDPPPDSMADADQPGRGGFDQEAGGAGQAMEPPEQAAEPLEDDGQSHQMEELRHELEELAADVDGNSVSVKALESQQEDAFERLGELEEHTARLLGVYDRLTSGINPFDEEWDKKYDQSRSDAADDEFRYNVIKPPEEPVQRGRDHEEPEPPAAEPTVSFDDIKTERERATEPVDEAPQPERIPDGSAYLPALAATYATDVLMMEWLTMLIQIAGSPGTLKALDYYENINWISKPVKHQLEDVLSGAQVPGETPAREPSDLTTEEHNRSFAFIMKLAQQRQRTPAGRPQ